VVVSDKGVGFDPASVWAEADPAGGGFGLLSIRERLALLGGELVIESAPQEGARLALIAPMDKPPSVAGPAFLLGGRPSDAGRPPARAPRPAHAPKAPAPRPAGARRPLRVLLADDHVVVRGGLAALLAEEDDIQVVGQAGDGRKAVQMARRLRPDCVLMDYSMPGLSGLEAAQALHAEFPAMRIVGLSMYDEADRAAAMLQAGAAAYVSKSGNPAALLEAIRAGAPAAARVAAGKARQARRRSKGRKGRRPKGPAGKPAG
jgi:DNA-binding NarL/FixJ family response regulator